MAVYFIADNENPDYNCIRVKIGYSGDVPRRVRELQTGSPQQLKLMGYLTSSDDRDLEARLHQKYRAKRAHSEWFNFSAGEVYEELRCHYGNAWISVEPDVFEVTSIDRDGIPEYVGAWQWDDVEPGKFCPKCGWGGGLRYNENFGGEGCLKCGFIG